MQLRVGLSILAPELMPFATVFYCSSRLKGKTPIQDYLFAMDSDTIIVANVQALISVEWLKNYPNHTHLLNSYMDWRVTVFKCLET